MIFLRRWKAAETETGRSLPMGGISVSSPKMACCSWLARLGSLRNSEAMASTTGGMASTKKAHRQPAAPPAAAAMEPTMMGPASCPMGRPMPSAAKTLARARRGYWSASRDECTGRRLDWPTPVKTLAQKNWKMLTTAPIKATVNAQKAVAAVTMRVRLMRSASQAIGTAPSTMATPPMPATPSSTVSETFKVSWMSGASTAMATLSNSSMMLSRNKMVSMLTPP